MRSIFVVWLMLFPAPAQDENNAEKLQVLRRIYAATVKVNAVYDDRRTGHGTGVSILRFANSEYKLVITNSHVVAPKNSKTGLPEVAPIVKVKPHGKGEVQLEAYVLYHELNEASFRDIAYLVVRDPDGLLGVATLPPGKSVAIGTPVWACGNPHELEFFMDHGKIVDPEVIRGEGPGTAGLILHNALIERGNSGGGVFNAKGELIGINTWLFEGKVAAAQDVFDFTQGHRLGYVSIHILSGQTAVNWKEYLTPGQGVRAMAFGTYTCWKDGPAMTAAGTPKFPEARKNKAFNFGSVMFSIAGLTKAFEFAYPGSDGKPVRYPDVVICDELREVGPFNFELNDANTLDNAGNIFIVYLVTGAAQTDIGIELAEPTDDERETRNLWLTVMDASGKSQKLSSGAKVVKLRPGSEAEACGLKVGDVIMTWPGPPVPEDPANFKRERVDAKSFEEHLRWSRAQMEIRQYGVKFGIKRGMEWIDLTLRFGAYKK
jgi:S1-C subfamily serine protease